MYMWFWIQTLATPEHAALAVFLLPTNQPPTNPDGHADGPALSARNSGQIQM